MKNIIDSQFKLIGPKEVAEKFNVNVDTIYRWVRLRKLPPPDFMEPRAWRWYYHTIDNAISKVGSERRVKTKLRVFKTEISVDPVNNWVREVINDIENSKIRVASLEKPDSYSYKMINDEMHIFPDATLEVDIKEWLGIACQLIHWVSTIENNEFIVYKNNFLDVILPLKWDFYKPLGPSAFTGTIQINKEILFGIFTDGTSLTKAAFQCLVAKALLQVFAILYHLIPAFLDWDIVWEHHLATGSQIDSALLTYDVVKDRMLKNVDEQLKFFWPNKAVEWISAYGKVFDNWPKYMESFDKRRKKIYKASAKKRKKK